MHVGRRADPDDVQIRQREQIRPVLHRRRVRHFLVAELQRAFVGRVRDGDNLDLRMLLQRRQMAITDDVARTDNTDAKLLIR
jgi:hypothetical protein